MMKSVVFKNARVFDGTHLDCPEGMQVLIESGVMREVSEKPIKTSDAHVIDVGGRTLMPGLIDAHVHAYTPTFSGFNNDHMPPSLMARYAATILCGPHNHRCHPQGPDSKKRADTQGSGRLEDYIPTELPTPSATTVRGCPQDPGIPLNSKSGNDWIRSLPLPCKWHLFRHLRITE